MLKADGIVAQRAWVWKNFTSGNQCLFMDPYLDPAHDAGRNNPEGGRPDPYWEPLRQAMGQTRRWAERLDLAAMTPHPELASTKWCLAHPGAEYLVYLPQGGQAEIDPSAAPGTFRVEWTDPSVGKTIPGEPAVGGARRTFTSPFRDECLLHLRRE